MRRWTALLLILCACADRAPFRSTEGPIEPIPNDPAAVSFFAIGDFGNGGPHLQNVVAEIDRMRAGLSPKRVGIPAPFVIELGDNIYPSGLADDRARAEAQLQRVFGETFGRHDMVVHVIPGNHDHLGNLEHQRTTARELFGERWSFHPTRGPPETMLTGPLQILWVDSVRMIGGEHLDADMERLQSLADPKAPWKLVAAHHPIRSHGPHGGHFEWYEHIFLSEFPLIPGLGGAAVAVRSAGLIDQDFSSDRYQAYIERMGRLDVDVILSGHEHSLQLLSGRPLQVVSGSASNRTPVTDGADTLFCWSEYGFVYFEVSESRMFMAFVGEDGTVAHTHSVAR